MNVSEIKGPIMALVFGIIFLIIGGVAGDIATAIGQYIIDKLNSTGGISVTTQFTTDVTNIVGPVFTILGVVLIVGASTVILRYLIGMVRDLEKP